MVVEMGRWEGGTRGTVRAVKSVYSKLQGGGARGSSGGFGSQSAVSCHNHVCLRVCYALSYTPSMHCQSVQL